VGGLSVHGKPGSPHCQEHYGNPHPFHGVLPFCFCAFLLIRRTAQIRVPDGLGRVGVGMRVMRLG
jgi:hypothetical protein